FYVFLNTDQNEWWIECHRCKRADGHPAQQITMLSTNYSYSGCPKSHCFTECIGIESHSRVNLSFLCLIVIVNFRVFCLIFSIYIVLFPLKSSIKGMLEHPAAPTKQVSG